MAKYIDAVKSADIISERLNIPLGDLVDIFADIPTADVVEVVRCKDCNYNDKDVCIHPDNITHSYDCEENIYNHYINVYSDHFSEKGERTMTCKDCIYEPHCILRISYGMGDDGDKELTDMEKCCKPFKNKANYAEVKHGEWTHKNGEMYCSECGGEALMDEVYYKSPYCPKCGAKMDGSNLSTIPTGSEGL